MADNDRGRRNARLAATVLAAAALGAAAAGARAADDEEEPRLLKAPGEAKAVAAIRSGERVLVAAGDAGLVVLDPGDEAAARSIPIEAGKALAVAARGETAYVTVQTSPGRTALAVVDLAAGTVVRTVESDGGRGVAIVGDDEVVVVGSPCRFVRPSTGEVLAEVEIPDGIPGGFHLREGTLHVARSYAGGVAFIDVKKRALVRVQGTEEWLSDVVALSETRALALGQFNGLGIVDLKTGRFEPLEGAKKARGALVPLAGGGAATIVGEAIWVLDATGEVSARHALPGPAAKGASTLAAAGAGEALLLLGDGRIAAIDLPDGEAKKSDTDEGEGKDR